MKKHVKFLLPFMVVALLNACDGGDDDGDSDNLNVTGTWRGALTKTEDTCGSGNAQTINFAHSVAQNGEAINLIDAAGTQYLGNEVGGNGFSVDVTVNSTVANATCQDHRQFEYDNIDDDDDLSANIDYRIDRTCPGQTCTIAYTGTGTRSGSSTNPTPNPTTTVTPSLAGGCLDINPNPAANTYSGDGGCGISDVTYRTESSNTVTLEPFGSNGITSFAVSSANTSAASSVRTDLTIQGESGYACSLTCSAPSTFTIRCLKEGGTSCVEKF